MYNICESHAEPSSSLATSFGAWPFRPSDLSLTLLVYCSLSISYGQYAQNL